MVEATVTCPLERIKVHYMTVDKTYKFAKFFEQIEGRVLKELFRGFTPLFMR